MSKTILQIATELNVSKTAIRKYMDEEFKAKYVTKEGERSPILISDEGVAIIREKCKGKTTANQEVETTANQVVETVETVEHTENTVTSELIKTLQRELETLNKQLDEKDKQIHELTEANKNLTETNKNLTASVQAAQALNAADKQLLIEATSKRSFWSRFFGRKKEPVQTQTDPTEPKDVN